MRGDLGEFGDFGDLGAGDLADLQAAFLAGPFADRVPHLVETPFGVTIGGLVVRGRIDAVYQEPDGGYLVVDWKTGARAPDPWQLAVYRVAFAELHDVPVERVRAAFYTVPTGAVEEPADLPGRAELEALLRA
jgi:DNA helicase-2/ATP-dependent DNA helicase PcrA